jgi:hypothetical protein
MEEPKDDQLSGTEGEERPAANREAGDWGIVGRIGTFSNHPSPDEELLVENIHTYEEKK